MQYRPALLGGFLASTGSEFGSLLRRRSLMIVRALVAFSTCPTSKFLRSVPGGEGDLGRDDVVTPNREDSGSHLGDLAASGTRSKAAR